MLEIMSEYHTETQETASPGSFKSKQRLRRPSWSTEHTEEHSTGSECDKFHTPKNVRGEVRHCICRRIRPVSDFFRKAFCSEKGTVKGRALQRAQQGL